MTEQEEFYYYGTGKRKTAVARVRLYPGDGALIVNDKPFEEIFTTVGLKRLILEPLQLTDTLGKFRVVSRWRGEGSQGKPELSAMASAAHCLRSMKPSSPCSAARGY